MGSLCEFLLLTVIIYNCNRCVREPIMRTEPKISEAEWELMKVLWERSPLSASEIIAAPSIKSWHRQTTKTLLGRLVKKGALGFEKQGRAYLYVPLVSEGDCITATSESFLRRVFGGSLMPMIAHFVEHKKLSAREIDELKRLIERKRK